MTGRLGFGEFELDLDAYELRRAGARVRIEKIPMEGLILLASRAGALVARSDLQAALWDADVFVEHEPAINTAIRKIRRALDDAADAPRFVETVVGKGYRFIAPVVSAPSPSADRAAGDDALPQFRLARGRRRFVLSQGESRIGRGATADVSIDHPSVSRHHAKVTVRRDRVILEDLASRNGTFVDGRPLTGPEEVLPGAVIQIGAVVVRLLADPAPGSTLSITLTPKPRGRRGTPPAALR